MTHHVLVCKDEDLIRTALADYLRSNGFEVSEAANGIDCLQSVERHFPDAILLDLNLPEMDGETVLKKIKAMGMHAPIYVMSGMGTGEASDASALGINGYFAKPYRLKEIAQTLKNHFAEK